MKIKDLPEKTNLEGIKVRTHTGIEGYWASQWEKGVWLNPTKDSTKIIPVLIEDLKDCLEWEIIE